MHNKVGMQELLVRGQHVEQRGSLPLGARPVLRPSSGLVRISDLRADVSPPAGAPGSAVKALLHARPPSAPSAASGLRPRSAARPSIHEALDRVEEREERCSESELNQESRPKAEEFPGENFWRSLVISASPPSGPSGGWQRLISTGSVASEDDRGGIQTNTVLTLDDSQDHVAFATLPPKNSASASPPTLPPKNSASAPLNTAVAQAAGWCPSSPVPDVTPELLPSAVPCAPLTLAWAWPAETGMRRGSEPRRRPVTPSRGLRRLPIETAVLTPEEASSPLTLRARTPPFMRKFSNCEEEESAPEQETDFPPRKRGLPQLLLQHEVSALSRDSVRGRRIHHPDDRRHLHLQQLLSAAKMRAQEARSEAKKDNSSDPKGQSEAAATRWRKPICLNELLRS